MFYKSETVALLVDGPNTYSCTCALGMRLDWARVRASFAERGRLIRAVYISPVTTDEADSRQVLRPLLDFLGFNGWRVVERAATVEITEDGRKRTRGASISVDVAVEAFSLAGQVDHIVLWSGDGAYTTLVHALQQMGKRVTVVSSIKTIPSICAVDLRRAADTFIDLQDLGATVAYQSEAA